MSTAPLHVLLVEDDGGFATLTMEGLGTLDPPIRIRHVSSLTAAIALLGEGPFDAILLDLGLPDCEGVQTVERMHAAASGIPIIVITAEDSGAVALEAMKRGADDYLVKGTVDPHGLGRSIRYARERSALRTALLQREAQLRQAHKMEAVGRLAGGVAHDFNNVLTAIFGYTDLLLDQFEEGDPRRMDLLEIRKSAERAAGLTRQLLAFSRKQVMQARVLDLHEVVLGVEKLLRRLVGEDIVIEIQTEPELWPVKADPGQVEQVLMNLVTNSRDAMPDGGRIVVRTGNADLRAPGSPVYPGLPPGEYAWLEVTDGGFGISLDLQPYIFEPFFTTKPMGKGTGLGLSTVYGIVKQMGGGIYLEPMEGPGTRFRAYLPRVPGAEPTSAA